VPLGRGDQGDARGLRTVEEKSPAGPVDLLIFSCSGGSNVGQISNQAAVDLARDGKGRLFCLAGIGGHVKAITEATKAGEVLVAIDGCPVHCAKKTLEHAGFSPQVHVVVTELGVEKAHNLEVDSAATRSVAEMVEKELEG